MRSTAVLRTALGLATLLTTPALAQRSKPALIVFITVDQMRADYVDRWSSQYAGGLARFRKSGAFFTNAYQDHGTTETAPGHSVTMSGRFPRSTGIVSNASGVSDPLAPLLTSRDAAASPFRFRGSVLMDWIRTRNPQSRGLSISRKDRGAILPMGRAKQNVFWYATSNGEFTTSTYYADTLPAWIKAVNARRFAQRHAGQSWNLLLPSTAYAEADSIPQEHAGTDFVFPHVLPADTARAATELPYTPFMDELVLSAALEGVRALTLGKGPSTDVLAISLSASDYVGHRYGPDSREQHDNYLHLDRALGAFIDSLYKVRDSSTIVFALTADHGVTSFPELAAARAHKAPLVRYDTRPAVATVRAALRSARVDSAAVTIESSMISVDRAAFDHAGVKAEPILRAFLDALRKTPGIARVDRVRELAMRDTVHDAVARRWYHMIPPDLPIEYVFTPVEGSYPVNVTAAEHGLPYDDDAHVPVLFYGPWFKAGRYATPALVADMAPTLARVAGVPPTERTDGHVLEQALVRTTPR
ncbi:MAG: putative phosphatase [Gemmatimonadetes bacterium]|nr:putative phosphatase [Gemmatimonadota bacterium]